MYENKETKLCQIDESKPKEEVSETLMQVLCYIKKTIKGKKGVG